MKNACPRNYWSLQSILQLSRKSKNSFFFWRINRFICDCEIISTGIAKYQLVCNEIAKHLCKFYVCRLGDDEEGALDDLSFAEAVQLQNSLSVDDEDELFKAMFDSDIDWLSRAKQKLTSQRQFKID